MTGFDDLYSGSADDASGLRVIGCLLLGEAEAITKAEKPKRKRSKAKESVAVA